MSDQLVILQLSKEPTHASINRTIEIIYRNSPYFEKTYLRYPVSRLLTSTKTDLK